MNVYDLITQIGEELNEDFTNAPVWTRDEILGYIREIVRVFSSLTRIVDKQAILQVDATTGECSVPSDFNEAFYLEFNGIPLDIVKPNELDFIDTAWGLNSTAASPSAATVYNSGKDAKVKLVPVPSVVAGVIGSSVLYEIYLSSPNSNVWKVESRNGRLVTSISSGTVGSYTLPGDGNYWDLSIDNDGRLITTITASSDYDVITLSDSGDNNIYRLTCNIDGELVLRSISYGKVVRMTIDGIDQYFSSNYGIIVDSHATGVTTNLQHVINQNYPFGTTIYNRIGDDACICFYKGNIQDTPTGMSELFVSDAYIPIIKHGVLSKAYSHDGPGRDENKSKILWAIFLSECRTLKNLFQRQ